MTDLLVESLSSMIREQIESAFRSGFLYGSVFTFAACLGLFIIYLAVARHQRLSGSAQERVDARLAAMAPPVVQELELDSSAKTVRNRSQRTMYDS